MMDVWKLLRVPTARFVAFLLPKFRAKRPSFTVWRTAVTQGPNGKRNGDVEVAKQQELEDVYDLGRTKLDLKVMINDDTITTLHEHDYGTAAYKEYQRLASKFDIDLPHPPLEKKIDREQKEQFFGEQIDVVERYILNNKPNHTRYLYNGAVQVEKSRRILEMSINENYNDQLKVCAKEVKEAAQNLDIDINEELNQLVNYYDFDTGCINRIKTKLCKVKQTAKRSEVDPTRIITNEYWAISLVRLPDSTHHDEHAFLILEGKTADKSKIWFADFVANDLLDLFRPGMRDGKVRIEYHESQEMVDSPSELLYRCGKKMMEIKKETRLLYLTWSIPKSTAQILIKNMEKQENNPPKYNILGNTALTSRDPPSHNCFTFAKMMLQDLNHEYIKVPGDKLDALIFSVASRSLVDNLGSNTLWVGMFVAGVGTAFLFQKLLNFY